MAPLPIKFQELVQLTSTGVDTQSIGFNTCVSDTHLLPTPIGLHIMHTSPEGRQPANSEALLALL